MNLETLRTHRDAILLLAKHHKLENVRVFGSVLRGNATENSDIDLLVHPQKGCSLFDICRFEVATSDLLGGQKIDVVDDEALKPILAPYILRDATPI